jgi:hypothetical protein
MNDGRTHQQITELLDALNELAKISGMTVECVALRDGDYILAAWHPFVAKELRMKCEKCTQNALQVVAELADRVMLHRAGG